MSNEMINIDGQDYEFDKLSDAAKAAITSIQYCDQRIQQVSSEWAVADTARMAYEGALKREVSAQ